MINLHHGDCLEVLKSIPDNSFDSIVTDPPAGIGLVGLEWDTSLGGRDYWIEWMSSIMRENLRVLKPGGYALVWALPRTSHWTGLALEYAGFEIKDVVSHIFADGVPKGKNIGISSGLKQFEGWNTALKPAHEYWWLVKKPISEKNITLNAIKHGTGGINIEESRVKIPDEPDHKGRYPANLIHDGSDEALAVFPLSSPSNAIKAHVDKSKKTLGIFKNARTCYGSNIKEKGLQSASRYFFKAKPRNTEKNKYMGDLVNNHPTVKSVALMSYLVNLITPKNGTCLDSFMGSGSTGVACVEQGFNFIGIERDEAYFEIAKQRIEQAENQYPLFKEAAS
jgi:site-specific DNA-methyltransferase (adenine-specific)